MEDSVAAARDELLALGGGLGLALTSDLLDLLFLQDEEHRQRAWEAVRIYIEHHLDQNR